MNPENSLHIYPYPNRLQPPIKKTVPLPENITEISLKPLIPEPLKKEIKKFIDTRQEITLDIPSNIDPTHILVTYLSITSKIPLLNKKEEILLAIAIKAGKISEKWSKKATNDQKDQLSEYVEIGQQAREEFIKANLRLVLAIIKKIYGIDDSILDFDLIGAGNVGLINAVDNFQHHRKRKFSTFAYYKILRELNLVMKNEINTIRISKDEQEKIKEFKRKVSLLEQKLRHHPTDVEISNNLGVSLDEIKLYHDSMKLLTVLSTDTGFSSDTGSIETADGNETVQQSIAILQAVKNQMDLNIPNPIETAETEDLKKNIEAVLIELMKSRTNYSHQGWLTLIFLKFFLDEYSNLVDEEVASILGNTKQAVNQSFSKAAKFLKQHPTIIQLYQDYIK